MFGKMRGFEHLMKAIEECTNQDLLINLLRLVSKPLQMLDSNWAMSYVLRIFTALKVKTEFYSINYHAVAREIMECL